MKKNIRLFRLWLKAYKYRFDNCPRLQDIAALSAFTIAFCTLGIMLIVLIVKF
jgi:hypothetical protein